MTPEARAALLARAEKLENEAIDSAESSYNTTDWPRKALAQCVHADLKIKAAAVLRRRAGERV